MDILNIISNSSNNRRGGKAFGYDNNSYKNECSKCILHHWISQDWERGGWSGDGVYKDFIFTDRHIQSKNFGTLVVPNYDFGERNELFGSPPIYYGRVIEEPWNPTYDECIDYGDKPITYVDVVKISKGYIHEGFIVISKEAFDSLRNFIEEGDEEGVAVTNADLFACEIHNKLIKDNEIRATGTKFYAISEDDIMNQTKKPDNIYNLCIEI